VGKALRGCASGYDPRLKLNVFFPFESHHDDPLLFPILSFLFLSRHLRKVVMLPYESDERPLVLT
jgi:hypothetical protein